MMQKDFEITALQETGKTPVTVFQIHGDIDTNTYTSLEEKAREAYQNGTRDLLLDLTEVKYISSAGFRALHMIYTMLRQGPEESDEAVAKGLRDGSYKSRHLKLVCPNPNIKMAMKTAGFDMYIQTFDDFKEALNSFN
jgi:anti-anti-sigma factor